MPNNLTIFIVVDLPLLRLSLVGKDIFLVNVIMGINLLDGIIDVFLRVTFFHKIGDAGVKCLILLRFIRLFGSVLFINKVDVGKGTFHPILRTILTYMLITFARFVLNTVDKGR